MSSYATDADRELCRRIHRRFGTSYYVSTLRFSKEQRTRVHAIYAFVRVPDEWVDNPGDLSVAERLAKLRYWRCQMHRGIGGERPENPVMRAFCDVALECGLPIEEADRFLDAMEMDLTVRRYANYGRLREYMAGSASAVGVLMCYAMRAELDEGLLARARALGEAMQLTNFLRDIGEDLKRDRIYMPLDELAAFGVREEDLANGRITPALRGFMAFQIQRARDLYAYADPGIDRLPREMRRAVRMASVLYSRILEAIERNGFDVFTKRARTGPVAKAWTWVAVSLSLRG